MNRSLEGLENGLLMERWVRETGGFIPLLLSRTRSLGIRNTDRTQTEMWREGFSTCVKPISTILRCESNIGDTVKGQTFTFSTYSYDTHAEQRGEQCIYLFFSEARRLSLPRRWLTSPQSGSRRKIRAWRTPFFDESGAGLVAFFAITWSSDEPWLSQILTAKQTSRHSRISVRPGSM